MCGRPESTKETLSTAGSINSDFLEEAVYGLCLEGRSGGFQVYR